MSLFEGLPRLFFIGLKASKSVENAKSLGIFVKFTAILQCS
jgi:hypothetical protein